MYMNSIQGNILRTGGNKYTILIILCITYTHTHNQPPTHTHRHTNTYLQPIRGRKKKERKQKQCYIPNTLPALSTATVTPTCEASTVESPPSPRVNFAHSHCFSTGSRSLCLRSPVMSSSLSSSCSSISKSPGSDSSSFQCTPSGANSEQSCASVLTNQNRVAQWS